jgi:hypothetical protein
MPSEGFAWARRHNEARYCPSGTVMQVRTGTSFQRKRPAGCAAAALERVEPQVKGTLSEDRQGFLHHGRACQSTGSPTSTVVAGKHLRRRVDNASNDVHLFRIH